MKQKITLLAVLFMILFSAACQQADNANYDALNPDHRNEQSETYSEDRKAQVGYVRYTREDLDVKNSSPEFVIDREEAADMITRIIMESGNFEETASLVTDREVIIAYEKNEDITETEAAELAERTVRSLLPDFYKVYPSANPNHMDEIHSLHREQTDNPLNHETIERIINIITEDKPEQDRR